MITDLLNLKTVWIVSLVAVLAACATQYKAQPVPFRLPSSYANATKVADVTVGAEAFVDPSKAKRMFGFDVLGAGLLPVQVAFDNQGGHAMKINPAQSFLVDRDGKLWPILQDRFAYERVTKYAETHEIFKEGAYRGFLGGVAGALVGAAVGVVSGRDIASSIGKGTAVGAAGGALFGGARGAADAEAARQRVMQDFNQKSLQNKPIDPGDLSYGFLFFPGEAKSAKLLRLQLIQQGTGKKYTLEMSL